MPRFVKNLNYGLIKDIDLQKMSRIAPIIANVGAQAFTELLLMHLHARVGMTFIIQKKVTDDLRLTDFHEGRFEDLTWPSTTIEFNFEDPALGTLLAGKLTRQQVLEASERLNVTLRGYTAAPDHDHQLIMVCQASDGSGSCVMVHDEHTWPRLMAGEEVESMTPTGPGDGRMEKAESAEMIDLAKLCMKHEGAGLLLDPAVQAGACDPPPAALRRGQAGRPGPAEPPDLPRHLPPARHPRRRAQAVRADRHPPRVQGAARAPALLPQRLLREREGPVEVHRARRGRGRRAHHRHSEGAVAMSRSHRNWPGGIHRCSKCGKEYKQGASLAAHIIAGCTPKKPRRSRYPKHYQDFLDRRAEAEAASLPKTL